MAGEKTYTEDEHLGILTERVRRETADLTAQVDQLNSDNTELQNQLDVAESAKVAAEARATEAEQALETFKADVEGEREAAARKEERIAKLRETAEHLDDDFFEDEKRVERIVAMADDAFDGYVADLAATGVGAPKSTSVPRETAMVQDGKPVTTKPAAGRSFLLRRYVAQEG